MVKTASKRIFKPKYTLIFILSIFAFLAGIAAVWPDDGIQISEKFTLKFPTFYSVFGIDTSNYVDIDSILIHKPDTVQMALTSLADSLLYFRAKALKNPKRLMYPTKKRSALYNFFAALISADSSKKPIRIMHYGDSQIEMDRISKKIREVLQQRFGGGGPGLQPAVQVIDSRSIRQSTSGGFRRYATWGFAEELRASHNDYGIMLNFSRFAGEGSIYFSKSSQSLPLANNISQVSVLAGNVDSALSISLNVDGRYVDSKHISPRHSLKVLTWKLDSFNHHILLSFSGGPADIYGIALDNTNGVALDNMPMRGCSGTIFTRVDSSLLANSIAKMNVKLIIFQFGGNMMPSINGPATAEWYGKRFYRQLMYIKNMHPDVSILTIGLSDMSTRINGKYQSYPFIVQVRNALKEATFKAGGAYWDVFKIMGGKNSMPSWVKHEPQLARSDHIHFTSKGASLIADFFTEALLNDFREYTLIQKINKLKYIAKNDTIR